MEIKYSKTGYNLPLNLWVYVDGLEPHRVNYYEHEAQIVAEAYPNHNLVRHRGGLMKYNTKSAEVLNESDDFERKLAWVLFKAEIEHIWHGDDWVPGDPIYRRPSSGMPGQQWIRAMVQEIPMGVFNLEGRLNVTPRCRDCHVSWSGEDPCWMCGEERREKKTASEFEFLRMPAYGTLDAVSMQHLGEIMQMMRESFQDTEDAFLRAFVQGVQVENNHLTGPRGISASQVIVDEERSADAPIEVNGIVIPSWIVEQMNNPPPIPEFELERVNPMRSVWPRYYLDRPSTEVRRPRDG